MNTRPIALGEFHAVAALLNAAYTLVGIDLGETAEDVRERSSAALVIVTEVAGMIAATMTLGAAGTRYGTLASPGQMEASRLAVDPLFQGRGVGRAMLQAVTESARNQGVQALVGVTMETMTTAHQLYESTGAKRIAGPPGFAARGYTLALTSPRQEN